MEHISFKQFTAAGFLSAQERKKERKKEEVCRKTVLKAFL
jgi:hypothetical protein